MQAAELSKYINDPQSLDKDSVAKLQQLVKDFPYFQSAHILLSMAAKKWDASIYQQTLKKTAIVSVNRAHLFRLISKMDQRETSHPEAPVVPESLPEEPEKKETVLLQEVEIAHEEMAARAAKKEEIAEVSLPSSPEKMLETEIAREVIHSFVEKEILKTPEVHRSKAAGEPGSFADWLHKMRSGQEDIHSSTVNPVTPPEQPTSARKKKQAIIDKIIENNPGLIRSREGQRFFDAGEKARDSVDDNEHLVTETLARIYALQGSTAKAIRAYEILSLKNPQKSAYFAALIKELKDKPKSNS
jgi:hypothetical protein